MLLDFDCARRRHQCCLLKAAAISAHGRFATTLGRFNFQARDVPRLFHLLMGSQVAFYEDSLASRPLAFGVVSKS